MSLVIPVGFGSAAFVFTTNAGTGPFVTTLGVDLSNAGADYVTAANQIKANYATAMTAITTSALTLDHVTLAIGQDGAGGSVDSDTAPVAMTAAGSFSALSMAVIARKTSNQFGRAGRGRMFLPGVCLETGIDPDGSLTASYRTSVQTSLNSFYSALTSNPMTSTEPVLLHSNTVPLLPTPVTAFTVSDLVGWIRGRIR